MKRHNLSQRPASDPASLAALQQEKARLKCLEALPYNENLRTVMVPQVYTCGPETPVLQALEIMVARSISSAVITTADGTPSGIMTEKDVIRRLTLSPGMDLGSTPVSRIMSQTPTTLSPDDSIYRALSILSAKKFKHLPLVEHDRVAGIVTLRQLLKLKYPEPLFLVEQIGNSTCWQDLKKIRATMPELAASKLSMGIRAADIVTMISLVNQDIHRRWMEIVRQNLGPPPAPFCLYVTGSHGRGENLLTPDQDHGMVIADSDQGFQYSNYFIELSAAFSDGLEKIGFPLCTGYVMCTNPIWRKSLHEWQIQFHYWVLRQVRELGRFATVLFDASPVYGERPLFEKMMANAFRELDNHHELLQVMKEEEERHRVPTGFFGRFLTEKTGVHKGELDIKRSGLLFVIEGVRILALKHAIRHTSTLKRINALVAGGHIHADDGEYFEAAFHLLLHLSLKCQLQKTLHGLPPDTFLKPASLSAKEQESLRHAFKAVTLLQELVSSSFGALVL